MRIFVLLGAILLYGTTGFVYFELSENPDLSWYDGLWYTVGTMTTVGYGDFFPKSTGATVGGDGQRSGGFPSMAEAPGYPT